MENLDNLLNEIREIKTQYYDEEQKIISENKFNIFSALYKNIDDEVRLHSRFISFLLSPTSSHGKNNFFANKLITEVLKIDFNFKGDYAVYPNEKDKTEKYNIDILLVDKNKRAIIIENKTRYSTSDSNDYNKCENYQGQLERYYHIIHTGKYCVKKGEEYLLKEMNNDDKSKFHCKNPSVFYLSVDDKQPNNISLGNKLTVDKKLKDKIYIQCIDYETHIIKWLEECKKELKKQIDENFSLIDSIEQYLIIVKRMTYRVKGNKKLKEILEKESYKVTKYLIENEFPNYDVIQYIKDKFNDIKWHTIDDFWLKLKKDLEVYYGNVVVFPHYISALNNISHNKKRKVMGISFKSKKGIDMYICYDNKGLTFGNIALNKWKEFNDPEIQKINFIDFDNEETFSLINKSNMNKITDKIINEIKEEISADFKNMKAI